MADEIKEVKRETVLVVLDGFAKEAGRRYFSATTGISKKAANALGKEKGFAPGWGDEVSLTRYEILWPVPVTGAEWKEQYNIDCPIDGDLGEVADMAMSRISTGPQFAGEFTPDENGNFPADLHEKLQALADGFKIGQRAPSATAEIKVKAAKLTAIEAQAAELGMSLEDLIALAKKRAGKR